MALKFNLASRSRELIETAISWSENGASVALVTLIAIEGNAPYPIGTQMLVRETGEFLGQITGGCAEVAIADQALIALKSKQNITVRYGLDSPYFDIKLPCGSGVDVYFDVTLSNQQLRKIQSELEGRRAVNQYLDTKLGKIDKCYLPTPQLIVAGQGPILFELTELATRTGFNVACVAQNQATQERLASVNLESNSLTSISAESPNKALGRNVLFESLDKYSAFVSLFHEHEHESLLLQAALATDSFYIGALGSRKTHAARREILLNIGLDEHQLDRIHGPVGLDIGANTPSQIAVSILSQVIKHMNMASAS